TFWALENGEAVELPPLDWSALAQQFVQAAPKAKPSNSALGGKDGGPGDAKPKLISLIDGKRAHNVNILMGGKIKIPVSGLRAAVVGLDPRIFSSEEVLTALAQCVPTPEEAGALDAFQRSGRPASELADADRVLYELMCVPGVEARLRCFKHVFAIPDKVTTASQVFQASLQASEQLQRSTGFKAVLRTALAAGNYLNYGTRNGNQLGFRQVQRQLLKNLPKLADLRTVDGKSTLMQVLAAEVLRMQLAQGLEPSVLQEELAALSNPWLKVSHQEAAESLSAVGSQLEDIRSLLADYVPLGQLQADG
ncbi:formin-like protein, partial [Haematococcus lacustris]